MPPLSAYEALRTELATRKHTPTAAMVNTAKRGLAQMKTKNHAPADEDIAMGRKIASGATLSDDLVRAVATYHSTHEYDCNTDDTLHGTNDMLWGGAPGSTWAGARAAALDVNSLSEDSLELGENDDLTLEIFVRDGLGEPIQMGDEGDGLIWAPILRSGTHAMRPGPYGEKLKDPLVIVPGIANDPHKEIGLENLYNSFKAGAVQHVTIPTTHDNGVLENNGYIVDMRIDDSTRHPGEKVLMGAHQITEPDVLGRLQRGSVANRSCGILHDYINTETGEHYPQVIEHVALTNKPWVRGMPAYGDLSETDFSGRQVVPMMLSETPMTTTSLDSDIGEDPWEGDVIGPDGLTVRYVNGSLSRDAVHMASDQLPRAGYLATAQKRDIAKQLIAFYRGPLGENPPENILKLASVSTQMSADELNRELLADVQWGDEPSLNDIRSQITTCLQNFRNQGNPGGPPYYYVMDVTASKALVQIEYGDPDGQDDAWVIPFTCADDGCVTLAQFSEWSPVQKQWVTDEDTARDRDELGAILGGEGMPLPDTTEISLSESTDLFLSIPQADRMKAAKEGNALPDGSYPIRNAKELHAAAVLAASGHGDVTAAKALIRKRAKELGVDVTSLPGFGKTNASEPRLQPQQERNNQQGGAMTPTTTEVLERLELSDEARAAVQKIADDNQRLTTQLAESNQEKRKTAVTARVEELQGKGFSPGFCAEYERIALADDGKPAAVLNLSENGVARDIKQTATELADRLIAAMPFDEIGKLALAGQAHLLESPLGGRPALTADDQNKVDGEGKPKTGDELLADWAKADPRGIAEFTEKLAPANGSTTTAQ